MTQATTEFLKNRVGRLRPDFLARCRWDAALQTCTGKHGVILDGRKSFPSGHASGAFSGMTFLSLWLAGNTAAWCFQSRLPARSVRSTRIGRLVLTLLPMLWALFVAVSRIEDYRHHKEDVIVGSLIGIFSSSVCYLVFWPNPLSARNFALEHTSRARLVYTDREDYRDAGFELTRLEDDVHAV
jgi:diacylglycerol diphosphate phosphatase/phosphatidate phosphatase